MRRTDKRRQASDIDFARGGRGIVLRRPRAVIATAANSDKRTPMTDIRRQFRYR
jgi:hypothetical protein